VSCARDPVRMKRPPVDRWWYTVRDGAAPASVAAVCRATLLAQRPRLDTIYVDVLSDEPWPDDVRWAVDELSALAAQQRRGDPTGAVLDPRVDRHVDLAAAVAPFTICAYGVDHDDEEGSVWSVDDTGTSCAFALRLAELAAVHRRLDALDVPRGDLVLFEVRRRVRWRRDDTVRLEPRA